MALTKISSEGITDDTLVNADINSSAAIDATKVADGTVTSTEFQYINTLSSNAQTQITNVKTTADAAAVLTGSTNNTIVTVTGANAIIGEANFTYDGHTLDVKNSGTASSINLYCETGNAHYIKIKSGPHASATSYTLTLPNAPPASSGLALTATTAGVASWSAAGASDLDGLSDALVENNSIWLGNDPSGTTDTSSYSVALGTTALDAITTGDNNTAIGYNALTVNTTGGNNTAVGYGAGATISTGSQNTAVGRNALDAATTVDNITAVGDSALSALTTATENTAVGTSAGLAIDTGTSNTIMGYRAMVAATTAASNVVIGKTAGDAMTTTSNNVVVGIDAGGNITTGYSHVAVGAYALQHMVDGYRNTAVGANAGGGTGNYNTSIGMEAFAADGTGGFNTCLGDDAGTSITTGDRNTCIGQEAGDTITTGANNIMIGRGQEPADGTTSNNLNLGGWLTGASTGIMNLSYGVTESGGTSTGTNRIRIVANGRVQMGPNLYDYAGAVNISGGSNGLRNLHIEDYQTETSEAVNFNCTDASFASYVLRLNGEPNSSSAFGFLRCMSNSNTDTEFLLRGDGNAYADATWNNSGADYAEFFESATGEPIPVGTTLVLDDNKVRAATADDSVSLIMGVSRPKVPSKASMILGNTAWNMWCNKYLTDDFDQYVMESYTVTQWRKDNEDGESIKYSYATDEIPADVTVPADAVVRTEKLTEHGKTVPYTRRKLNPSYDPSVEYVPREDRDEWIIVGIMGQIPIIKGQPVNSSWIKMRDISASVEEWLVK